MTSISNSLVVLLMVLISVSTITFAKDFIVGDQVGWTVGFDYTAWAATKEFHVEDRLVFQYPVGAHNVYKVNGTQFKECSVPIQSPPLNSGNDFITLSTPGKKWYICGVPNHCLNGQRLAITVLPKPEIAPSQPPTIVVPPAPRVQLPWIAPAPTPYVSEAMDYETNAPSQPPKTAVPPVPRVQFPWIAAAPAPAPYVSKAMDYDTVAPSQPPPAVAPSAPRFQPPWIAHVPAPYFF